MQQPVELTPITPIYRELRPQQEVARPDAPPAKPPDLTLADQMRRIEQEEEPERWDGLS